LYFTATQSEKDGGRETDVTELKQFLNHPPATDKVFMHLIFSMFIV